MRKCDTCCFHYDENGYSYCRVAADPFKFKGHYSPTPGGVACPYYCFYGLEPDRALELWGSGLQNRRDNSVLTQALEDTTIRGESGSARRFLWSDDLLGICDACSQRPERLRAEALRRIVYFGLKRLCHDKNALRGYFDKYGPNKTVVVLALYLELQKWDAQYFQHNWTWPAEGLEVVEKWMDKPGMMVKL